MEDTQRDLFKEAFAPDPVSKSCSQCKEEKTLDSFHKQRGGLYGVRSVCKSCVANYSKSRHSDTYKPRERVSTTECGKCHGPRTGQASLCRNCLNDKIRDMYKEHPERRQRRNEWAKQWREENPDRWKEIYTKANQRAAERRKMEKNPKETKA